MSNDKYRLPATICLLLGFAVLYVICLLTAIHAVGTDDALYYSEQTAARVLPEAGISDADLRTLDGELSKYLAGRPNELVWPSETVQGAYTVLPLEIDGELRPAFNEREVQHLVDCHDLFALLRKVRSRLVAWALVLVLAGARFLNDRKRIRRVAWWSPLVLLLPLGAFAVYAAANFDAAFTLFHRVLFSNDLWLLDPRTDLLIRICPQSMFMHMGARIALWTAAAVALIVAAATVLTVVWPKKREDTTWNNRDMRRASANKRVTFEKRGTR